VKTIIAGSRTIRNLSILEFAITQHDKPITTVLCGMASGADMLGLKYAQAMEIPIEKYPADWHAHGKSAGYIRNEVMARHAEACIVLWDGSSKGSKHMITMAKRYNLVLTVVNVSDGICT
jgi:hypothetical protein